MKVQRIPLLDNGQTIIRHIPNPGRAKNVLVVTFAEMMMNDPDKPGFGQDFLLRQGVDMVTVQKRSENWYQDLKVDHFRRAIEKVSGDYDRIVCYGLSMGAFASLYYGGVINASILAISPLCSIHPLFPQLGHSEYRRQVAATQCDLGDAVRSERPTYIIYDPLVRSDAIYIRNEVRPAFPNAIYAIAPGSGHPSAACLSGMGLLKSIMLDFIDQEDVPDIARLMRPLRARSPEYLENMSDLCKRRRRPRQALQLIERAMGLAPDRAGITTKHAELTQRLKEIPSNSSNASYAG